MRISVIVPTYKPKEYLWDCLGALAEQSFPKDEYEVILVLNGCTEPYKSEIEQYIVDKSQSMNVIFIHTEVTGVSNARNVGLDSARGEFVAFVDDDDIVSDNYLENLYKVSSSSCVGCSNSYCFLHRIDEMKKNFITEGYKRCVGKKFSLFRYRAFLSPPVAKLIHRNIIGNNRFPLDLKKSEDSVFCMRISPNIGDMQLASADTIYYQRERSGSAMRTRQSMGKVIKEHLYIEWKYISEWFKRPFSYDFLFVLSRIIACGKNCYTYISDRGQLKS